MTVTGLTPGKEYKFRVSAVNAEGESDPLQTEESIIAKNPFGIYMLTSCNILNIILFDDFKSFR